MHSRFMPLALLACFLLICLVNSNALPTTTGTDAEEISRALSQDSISSSEHYNEDYQYSQGDEDVIEDVHTQEKEIEPAGVRSWFGRMKLKAGETSRGIQKFVQRRYEGVKRGVQNGYGQVRNKVGHAVDKARRVVQGTVESTKRISERVATGVRTGYGRLKEGVKSRYCGARQRVFDGIDCTKAKIRRIGEAAKEKVNSTRRTISRGVQTVKGDVRHGIDTVKGDVRRIRERIFSPAVHPQMVSNVNEGDAPDASSEVALPSPKHDTTAENEITTDEVQVNEPRMQQSERVTTPVKNTIARICSSPNHSKDAMKPLCKKYWQEHGRPTPPPEITGPEPWPETEPAQEQNNYPTDPANNPYQYRTNSDFMGNDPLADYSSTDPALERVPSHHDDDEEDFIDEGQEQLDNETHENNSSEGKKSSTRGVSTTSLAWIIIGSVVGVCLLAGAGYIYAARRKDAALAAKEALKSPPPLTHVYPVEHGAQSEIVVVQ